MLAGKLRTLAGKPWMLAGKPRRLAGSAARLARNVALPEACASQTRSPGGLHSRVSPADGSPMLKCRPCDVTAQPMPKLALRDVPADLHRCSKQAARVRSSLGFARAGRWAD
jgi:hypothetical protein